MLQVDWILDLLWAGISTGGANYKIRPRRPRWTVDSSRKVSAWSISASNYRTEIVADLLADGEEAETEHVDRWMKYALAQSSLWNAGYRFQAAWTNREPPLSSDSGIQTSFRRLAAGTSGDTLQSAGTVLVGALELLLSTTVSCSHIPAQDVRECLFLIFLMNR